MSIWRRGHGDTQQHRGFTVCSRAPPFMRNPNDPIDHSPRPVTSYLHPSCYCWRKHLCNVCAGQKWKLCQRSMNDLFLQIWFFSLPPSLPGAFCLNVLWVWNKVRPNSLNGRQTESSHSLYKPGSLLRCWIAGSLCGKSLPEVLSLCLSVSLILFI